MKFVYQALMGLGLLFNISFVHATSYKEEDIYKQFSIVEKEKFINRILKGMHSDCVYFLETNNKPEDNQKNLYETICEKYVSLRSLKRFLNVKEEDRVKEFIETLTNNMIDAFSKSKYQHVAQELEAIDQEGNVIRDIALANIFFELENYERGMSRAAKTGLFLGGAATGIIGLFILVNWLDV